MLPHSTPVDPNTQNPAYSTPVDPQTPNSFYSALAEREHKTRATVKILVSQKYLPFTSTWAQGIARTQRIHFWIGNDLRLVGKLLRSHFFSWIQRHHGFCHRFTQVSDSPIDVKFPTPTVLLLEQKSSTSHFRGEFHGGIAMAN